MIKDKYKYRKEGDIDKRNKKRQDHEIKKMIEMKLKIMEKDFTKEYMEKYLEYEKNLNEGQRNKAEDICRKINDYLDSIDVEHDGRWYIFASLMIDNSNNYL